MKIPTSQKTRPRITAWIGYLLLCTVLFTCVTFSNYVTSSTGGDSARVAKWDVEVFGDTEKITIDGSDSDSDLSGTYTLTVKNNSEVAAAYTVKITTESALPAGIQFKIGDTVQESNGSATDYTFSGGELSPGKSATHTLTITAILDTLMSDVNQDVTVNVYAEQID